VTKIMRRSLANHLHGETSDTRSETKLSQEMLENIPKLANELLQVPLGLFAGNSKDKIVGLVQAILDCSYCARVDLTPLIEQERKLLERIQGARVALSLNESRVDELRKWVDPFREDNGRMRLNSKIHRCRVWVLGIPVIGKTTTIGRLLNDPRVRGRAGFSHHTMKITEYDMNYIWNREIRNVILMDTRGTSDTGLDVQYTSDDLYIDMNQHLSQSDESKILFIMLDERLKPEPSAMIKKLVREYGSNFMILLTRCERGHATAVKDFQAALKQRDIQYTGLVASVNWPSSEANDQTLSPDLMAKRWDILESITNWSGKSSYMQSYQGATTMSQLLELQQTLEKDRKELHDVTTQFQQKSELLNETKVAYEQQQRITTNLRISAGTLAKELEEAKRLNKDDVSKLEAELKQAQEKARAAEMGLLGTEYVYTE